MFTHPHLIITMIMYSDKIIHRMLTINQAYLCFGYHAEEVYFEVKNNAE